MPETTTTDIRRMWRALLAKHCFNSQLLPATIYENLHNIPKEERILFQKDLIASGYATENLVADGDASQETLWSLEAFHEAAWPRLAR